MDGNTPIDAVTESAKAVQSFSEWAKEMLSPFVSVLQTKADLYDAKKKIEFARSNPEVDFAIREDGKVVLVTSGAQAVRACKRFLADAERTQRNLEDVYRHGAREIGDIDARPETPINEDWVARFNAIAQDVSDKDMQFVLGKILAGEFQRAGSYSLRALDIVKNLSQQEAQLISKIAPLVILCKDDAFVSSNENGLKMQGITYADVMRLNECGFLCSAEQKQMSIPIEPGKNFSCRTKKHEIVFANVNGRGTQQIRWSGYRLSHAGSELMRAIDVGKEGDGALEFAEDVKKQNAGKVEIIVRKIPSCNE